MRVGVEVKVTRSRYRQLSRQGQQAMPTWNARNAEEMAKIARRLAPVDTGALRDSIAVRLDRRSGTAAATAGDANVDYAAPVEFGTSRQPAQPFMTPAAERVKRTAHNRRFRVYR